MINIDDFNKIDFRVGEVINIDKNKLEINVGERNYFVKLILKVKKRDKIAVIISGDKIVIPSFEQIPLIPDKDIEVGSKIS